MKVLITCPRLIENLNKNGELLTKNGIEYFAPKVVQQLSKKELLEYVPEYDGWIVGDDPADREILEKGVSGKLKAVVKWGVGTDNIDQKACKDLGLKFTNIPNSFGDEVANVALGYLINLSRQLHIIDKAVRVGNWVNPVGFSLKDKKVTVIGFGDIGHNVVERLLACKMNVSVVDPYFPLYKMVRNYPKVNLVTLNRGLESADIIILCCVLNKSTHHLVNDKTISVMKDGVYIVNVSRGAIVETNSVVKGLDSKKIAGFASDVFEEEPYDKDFVLTKYDNCILGTHNASNTKEAVERTSIKSIEFMVKYLK